MSTEAPDIPLSAIRGYADVANTAKNSPSPNSAFYSAGKTDIPEKLHSAILVPRMPMRFARRYLNWIEWMATAIPSCDLFKPATAVFGRELAVQLPGAD